MKKTLTQTRVKIKTGALIAVAIGVISVGGIMAASFLKVQSLKSNKANCKEYWAYNAKSNKAKCKKVNLCGEFMSEGLKTFKTESECTSSISSPVGCVNNCGDGICARYVCHAMGCPCAETDQSCAKDCAEKDKTNSCKKEGEMCGGIANFKCCSGLTCDIDGNYPDASGVCERNSNNISSSEVKSN